MPRTYSHSGSKLINNTEIYSSFAQSDKYFIYQNCMYPIEYYKIYDANDYIFRQFVEFDSITDEDVKTLEELMIKNRHQKSNCVELSDETLLYYFNSEYVDTFWLVRSGYRSELVEVTHCIEGGKILYDCNNFTITYKETNNSLKCFSKICFHRKDS